MVISRARGAILSRTQKYACIYALKIEEIFLNACMLNLKNILKYYKIREYILLTLYSVMYVTKIILL